MSKQLYLGLMSGTSLDGLDLALCRFSQNGTAYGYEILAAETVAYTKEWEDALRNATTLYASELTQLDRSYGKYLGETVTTFLDKHGVKDDVLICSHGHTVFHNPALGYTLQIGYGPAIRAASGLQVLYDFRSLDVALGGQGAPLVPIGDAFLFGDYAACLNLGGFANISYQTSEGRIAYDICPINIILNRFAQELGHAYDDGGAFAASGQVHPDALAALEGLDFYRAAPPKSLGAEFIASYVQPMLGQFSLTPKDWLRTFTEHAALRIGEAIASAPAGQTLVTGGGAYNKFLLERIGYHLRAQHKLIIPTDELVQFKEALIFAVMGYLHQQGIPNTIPSVTGARAACVAGTLVV